MKLAERTIQKDGCDIHYWLTPDHAGPWIIFLHGAGADHRMFDDQLAFLDIKYGVLLWDARGHGRSRPMGVDFSIKLLVEDMLTIMNTEGIAKATFVGQSMGGNTAQEIIFHYPERVDNLVLIDCTCNTMKLRTTEKWAIKLTPLFLSMYPWNLLVKQSALGSSTKPHVQSYLRDCFMSVGKQDFHKMFIETTACLHEDENYRINKPLLLICGEHDNTGNIKKIVMNWASREPKCEFHWIADAGHCANQDNPEALNKLLLSFLERNSPLAAEY
ncbi:alpha/beta fold hydrolase [Paenibacillus nasutitermitis]|uniref:Alpha/beta hydrolase n=1 Tax=Paenibacillus nasutitermitis TaxID=1652958 RepID=A0A916YVS8_9BACL|nr:alpha/beta hydrolase [Paenibacillus nasutitermitis]GGD63128.1 alpha/beta hydrolase [Paenibacillus nasutitermitis]